MTRRRALVGCEMSGEVRDALAGVTGEDGEPYWDEVWSADILPSERPAMTFVAADSSWANVPARPEDGPRVRHYQGDVRDLFDWEHPVNRIRLAYSQAAEDTLEPPYPQLPVPLWDFAMFHPPCTDLSLAGARYWKSKRVPRLIWDEELRVWRILPSVQLAAAGFFMAMANAPAKYVAVENPRGDMTRRYRAPDQYVQPWWFGDPVEKATGWWLKNLPPLVPDCPVEPSGRVTTGGGSHRTDMRKNGRSNNGHEDSEGRARRHIVRSRTLPGLARAAAQQWTAYIEKQEEK